MEKRKEFWRALPFVMALLLLTLVPMQSASALFGKGKEKFYNASAFNFSGSYCDRCIFAER